MLFCQAQSQFDHLDHCFSKKLFLDAEIISLYWFFLENNKILWFSPKHFCQIRIWINIFCELGSRDLPLFPPLQILVTQIFVESKFFGTQPNSKEPDLTEPIKMFWDPTFLVTKHFFGPKIFPDLKIFGTWNVLGPKNFWRPKILWDPQFLRPSFLRPKYFGT